MSKSKIQIEAHLNFDSSQKSFWQISEIFRSQVAKIFETRANLIELKSEEIYSQQV